MTTYRASWPIIDPTVPREALIAQATRDLLTMRPAGYGLYDKKWTVDGDTLHLTADARPLLGNAANSQEACNKGHEWTPESTMSDGRGGRRCRTCHNARNRARKARLRGNGETMPASRADGPTLPARPLLTALRAWPDDKLSETDRKAIQRAKVTGWLKEDVADRIACRLGLHPCLIWPEWFEVAA